MGGVRLDIKRQLSTRSTRVKDVDLHPTEPWVACSLYSGSVQIWNTETQQIVKELEVLDDEPLRAAKFIPRKNWIVTGADDNNVRIYNYNTQEKIAQFGHNDYIRCIAVHPTQPLIITGSDDRTIKIWDWEKNFRCIQVFEEHMSYVMDVVLNPKDTNTFASGSNDSLVKVWQIGNPVSNFTLEGHKSSVNGVAYYKGGDKPLLLSCSDERNRNGEGAVINVWDYQSRTCLHSIKSHTGNISSVAFHPSLPMIITGSEDGTVRLWHSGTYKSMNDPLNYGMERCWAVATVEGSNNVALAFDEGTIVIKLGRDEPCVSMDQSGKVVYSRQNTIMQANLKAVNNEDVQDGEPIPLSSKELGNTEIFPTMVKHSPNGRFLAVCGDGEYVIYTALSLRNKAFGSAMSFVWATDSGEFCARESSHKVKIYGKNFQERQILKTDMSVELLFGGHLIGVKSSSALAFYHWATGALIRKIEIAATNVTWSENADLVAISTEDGYYILRLDQEKLNAYIDAGIADPDGVDCLEMLGESDEAAVTSCWVGDCFVYASYSNRLSYFVGGSVVNVSHLEKQMYILGFLPSTNRVYLADKDANIVSYRMEIAVLQYETAVMRKDFTTADTILPRISKEQRVNIASFLEKQGFKEQALVVTDDLEQKFELAISLGKLDVAMEIADQSKSHHKWKKLSQLAMSHWDYKMAEMCLKNMKDLQGLMLLYTSTNNATALNELAERAKNEGVNNVAFHCMFLLHRLEDCIDLLLATDRLPEAAMFSYTYLPSKTSEVVGLWKKKLSVTYPKMAESIADPEQYPNLFDNWDAALKAEKLFSSGHRNPDQSLAELNERPEGSLVEQLQQKVQNGFDVEEALKQLALNPTAVTAPVEESPVLEAPAASLISTKEDITTTEAPPVQSLDNFMQETASASPPPEADDLLGSTTSTIEASEVSTGDLLGSLEDMAPSEVTAGDLLGSTEDMAPSGVTAGDLLGSSEDMATDDLIGSTIKVPSPVPVADNGWDDDDLLGGTESPVAGASVMSGTGDFGFDDEDVDLLGPDPVAPSSTGADAFDDDDLLGDWN